MQYVTIRVGVFVITLSIIISGLLWVRAVPLTIGQWIMHEAASFMAMLLCGPLLLVVIAVTGRTWPVWVKKLVVSVVGWTMLCGVVVLTERQMPADGLLVGIMAVVFAIALPWMIEEHLNEAV